MLASNGLARRESGDAATELDTHRDYVSEISRFYAIAISMFYVDDARPHFHARCGGESIAIEIDGDGLRGTFTPSRLPLLFEWRDRHREELRANWERVRAGAAPQPISPLD